MASPSASADARARMTRGLPPSFLPIRPVEWCPEGANIFRGIFLLLIFSKVEMSKIVTLLV